MTQSIFLSLSIFFLVVISGVASAPQEGQSSDPCTPNPCGDNTRCSSSPIRGAPVISCECLIGYEVPVGGDPFDGCIELGSGTKPGGSRPQSPMRDDFPAEESPVVPALLPALAPSPPPPVLPLATTPQTPRAIEFKPESRLQEGKRPSLLPPRRSQGAGIIRPNQIQDVDTPELFPEDCLLHEDCETNEYCTPPPENKCVDACTLDVCGSSALCLTRIHRPLCVCPDGFEGNPYDKCEKTPSRVGQKFKK